MQSPEQYYYYIKCLFGLSRQFYTIFFYGAAQSAHYFTDDMILKKIRKTLFFKSRAETAQTMTFNV
jgi:hypothetical protein